MYDIAPSRTCSNTGLAGVSLGAGEAVGEVEELGEPGFKYTPCQSRYPPAITIIRIMTKDTVIILF
jgi:hypothetical protein